MDPREQAARSMLQAGIGSLSGRPSRPASTARESWINPQSHSRAIDNIITDTQKKQKMWKDLGGPGTSGVKQFPKFNTAPGAGSIRSGIVPGWLQAGITNPNLGGSGGGGGFLNWLSDYRMRKDEEEKAKENKWFHDLPGSELMQYQNPHTREMYTQDEYFPPEHPIWDIEQPAGGGGGGEDPFGVAKVDPWDWRNLETIIKAGENPDDYVAARRGLMSLV